MGFGVPRPEPRFVESIHWIWACGGHYKDETGKSTHVMGTVAEITERKRADELRLRSQKLEGFGSLPAKSFTISTTFSWPLTEILN